QSNNGQIFRTVNPYPQFNPSGDAAVLDKAMKTKALTLIFNEWLWISWVSGCQQALETALKAALKGDLENVVLALLKTPAQYDAELLKHATKGLGTDEDTLIEILASRTNKEIRDLKKVYKEEYKKDLEEDIKSDTHGSFRNALLALCKASRCEDNVVNEELADADAKAIYEAGEKRKGTDCTVFIDILTTRSPAQLRKVFQLYSKYSKVDVSKAVDLELSGDIENCLTAIGECVQNIYTHSTGQKATFSFNGPGTREKMLTRIIVSRSEIDLAKIKEEYKSKFGKTLCQEILDDTKGDYEKILLAHLSLAAGVDESTIIEVLVKRSNDQRQQIKAAYQQATGKPLDAALKAALKGDLEDVVLALLKTPAQYDAEQLKLAMKGIGTDELTLIEILASRTNKEIRDIKRVYKEVYKKELEDDIKSDTSGDFRNALTALLFHRLFAKQETSASPSTVFQMYSKYSKVDVGKAIDLELKGDIEDLLTAVVKCAGSKPAFFAEKLYLSMKGSGTRCKILTRVMVSRAELDMVKIKEEYKKMYGKTLYQDILDDTKGDYEKILLALCGSES
uniref:Annexin n=1 Tax=Denticeps clupeoides TaxID=299321 RepID=A0AAY4D1J1_9TELE